jgi:hypothetical protein
LGKNKNGQSVGAANAQFGLTVEVENVLAMGGGNANGLFFK